VIHPEHYVTPVEAFQELEFTADANDLKNMFYKPRKGSFCESNK